MIIGITGKSGVGKNHFAEQLKKINPALVHIDVDKIGHEAMVKPEILDQIIAAFGDSFIEDGKINRPMLGDLIFNNREKYKELSKIVWDEMEKAIDGIIAKFSDNMIEPCDFILNWILLPKSKYWDMCDIKYLITRDEINRVESVLKRDNISHEYLIKRDMNGIDYDENDFDWVVNNNG